MTTGQWDNPGRTERDEHHRPGERPAPEWCVERRYLVGRLPGAFADEYEGRAAAVAAFRYELLAAESRVSGRHPYSPHDTSRRLAVVGPAVHRRAPGDFPDTRLYIAVDDDAEDPLLHGDVAVRAVLGADYDLLLPINARTLTLALLES